MSPLTFFHGPFEAGHFAGPDFPRRPGVFAYTPVEGDGHDELRQAWQVGAEPRCHFDEAAERTSFTVKGSPRYGRLELADFATGPTPAL